MEFVNGKDDIPYEMEKSRMFRSRTTNQLNVDFYSIWIFTKALAFPMHPADPSQTSNTSRCCPSDPPSLIDGLAKDW